MPFDFQTKNRGKKGALRSHSKLDFSIALMKSEEIFTLASFDRSHITNQIARAALV
jgi:hypothetical protein